jgi:hypothetical protein
MKDVEQKPSAASSDEERLAAGISTIGLQTKRLWSAAEKTHCLTEIHPADSVEWRLKQYSSLSVAARPCLVSAIMFLGN